LFRGVKIEAQLVKKKKNGLSQDTKKDQTKRKGSSYSYIVKNAYFILKRFNNLCIRGLDNSGKSSTVQRFCGDHDITKISPTLGFKIISLEYKQYIII
jgi:hypothetical protein